MAERKILTCIPAVVGPTASGKTALAISLAARLGGEIVSCDSMQIYREMDIGTAKPSVTERAAVPHHLIDFVSPDEPYSASDYAKDALVTVEDILARGHLPIFCGGTGLYLSTVIRGGEDAAIPGETAHRARLEEIGATAGGADLLYTELCEKDPESAAATHKNNLRRVIRALEVYYATGVPKSEWDRRSREKEPALRVLPFMIDWPRELLYARIEARVDAMLAEGLLDEVRRLYEAQRLLPNTTAGQAIGYKEFSAYLRGETDYETAVADLKTATRRYAKRQLTWFSADPHLIRLSALSSSGRLRTAEELAEEAITIYNENNF